MPAGPLRPLASITAVRAACIGLWNHQVAKAPSPAATPSMRTPESHWRDARANVAPARIPTETPATGLTGIGGTLRRLALLRFPMTHSRQLLARGGVNDAMPGARKIPCPAVLTNSNTSD